MKNNKSSVVFLMLIPFFFIGTLIVFDTIFNYVENKKFKNITETIIRDIITNDDIDKDEYYEEIKKGYERNNYETDMLIVDVGYKDIYLENEHEYFGVFSSLFGRKGTEVDVEIFGITFRVKKSSVARINVTASENYDGELEFLYTE